MTSVRIRNGPGIAHYPPGAVLGPRVLPCFEFVWMLTGRATWESAGDSVDLRPGELFLARPGVHETYRWDPGEACSHAYVTFYADTFYADDEGHDPPATRQLTDPLAGLARYLLWLGGSETRTAQVVGWMLDLFRGGPLPGQDGAMPPEQILRVAEHLRSVWRDGTARPASLTEMAAAAHVSPGHLARVFREHAGTGPVAAVELVRLARAATLLQRSTLTVAAVAEACGFVSPFHFSRRFREAYAMPPRSYRATPSRDPLDPLRQAGLLPFARELL